MISLINITLAELIRSIELVNANSFLVERDSVHVIDKEFAPSSSENSKKEKLIESEVDVDGNFYDFFGKPIRTNLAF